ncbi:hypothetical protein CYMTET_30176, partial [Cymbomonas tetramitiformis]
PILKHELLRPAPLSAPPAPESQAVMAAAATCLSQLLRLLSKAPEFHLELASLVQAILSDDCVSDLFAGLEENRAAVPELSILAGRVTNILCAVASASLPSWELVIQSMLEGRILPLVERRLREGSSAGVPSEEGVPSWQMALSLAIEIISAGSKVPPDPVPEAGGESWLWRTARA